MLCPTVQCFYGWTCWSCLWGYTEELCAGEGQSFLSSLVSPSADCEDEADLHPLPARPDISALTSSEQFMLEEAHPELPCSA